MAPPSSSSNKIGKWDPVLIISQIICIQTLHYLTLSVIIPPLLALLTRPEAVAYEGGAFNVGMVMDWREMAGYRTAPAPHRHEWDGVYSGGRKLNVVNAPSLLLDMDWRRSWVLAFCWIFVSGVDIFYLYTIIKRPRFVLDFACTLLFNHLVLTSYYAAALPTSLFFWLVTGGSCAVLVVCTEQLCVSREMREGLAVVGVDYSGGEGGVLVDPENRPGAGEEEVLFAAPEDDEDEVSRGQRSASDQWESWGGEEGSSKAHRTLSQYMGKHSDTASSDEPPIPLQYVQHAARPVNTVS